jgi:hypothetical protein
MAIRINQIKGATSKPDLGDILIVLPIAPLVIVSIELATISGST